MSVLVENAYLYVYCQFVQFGIYMIQSTMCKQASEIHPQIMWVLCVCVNIGTDTYTQIITQKYSLYSNIFPLPFITNKQLHTHIHIQTNIHYKVKINLHKYTNIKIQTFTHKDEKKKKNKKR